MLKFLKQYSADDFLWAVFVVMAWIAVFIMFAMPSKDTKPIATIDCDIVHTIPNMPDSVLKQCERMKIK
jgi:hypothetical protein